MNRKKFNALDYIEQLNRFRINSVSFERTMAPKICKSIGLPSNALFCTIFLNSEIVQRDASGLYSFINEPIHYTVLDKIYNNYHKRMMNYHYKWYNKKRDPLKNPEVIKAINLLKANGFLVVREVL